MLSGGIVLPVPVPLVAAVVLLQPADLLPGFPVILQAFLQTVQRLAGFVQQLLHLFDPLSLIHLSLHFHCSLEIPYTPVFRFFGRTVFQHVEYDFPFHVPLLSLSLSASVSTPSAP